MSYFQLPCSWSANHREANAFCGLASGGGIIKLQNDVQMCGYQDVQVMWEMVRISEMELSNKPKKRKRLLWRLLAWLNQSSSGDPMDPH